jgi:hypothetical protein
MFHVSFFFSRKSDIIKSCLFSEDLIAYKISWSCVEWCTCCVHLSSSNVSLFGMVQTTALKLWRQGHLQWHDLLTELDKNLPVGSKLDRGENTQTGW